MTYVKDVLEKVSRNELTLEQAVNYFLDKFELTELNIDWLKTTFPRKDLVDEIDRQLEIKKNRRVS